MTASRIEAVVMAAEADVVRVDDPMRLPPPDEVDLLVVDWAERGPDWGHAIAAWRGADATGPRVVLFGPHTDLEAHAAAQAAGLGPMRARSGFFAALPELIPRVREG